MKIQDIMTAEVGSCRPADSLSDAVQVMSDRDCGIVPVIDDHGHVLGVITDRDICLACWSRDARPGEVRISDAMSKAVKTCQPEDTVAAAEKTMEMNQIRRLPVTDANGRLVGIVSLNDIAREAERERKSEKREAIRTDEVIEALAAICQPRSVHRGTAAH